MASNNEIMRSQLSNIEMDEQGAVVIHNLGQAYTLAEIFDKAHILPKNCTVEGAMIRIMRGASLHMLPSDAVQDIADINGRAVMWGDALLSLVKCSGLLEDEETEYLPNIKECRGVRYTCKRKGMPHPYVGFFSLEMAKTAGLLGKSGPWQTAPLRMMLNRARTFALRDGFADVLKGMRCAEEEKDNLTTGETVDANFTETEEAPKKVSRRKVTRIAAADIPAIETEVAAPAAEVLSVPVPETEKETVPVAPAETVVAEHEVSEASVACQDGPGDSVPADVNPIDMFI